LAFVISEACVDVKDKACLTECPVDCIYEGERMTYIQPLECIDCGACQPLCPQDAIYYEHDVPPDLAAYVAVNAEFFATVGAPGGAGNVDLSHSDHDVVRALPPRPTTT
jgi:NAD-dependent dihydropyrimidine dehydrogenase PreA subunit